MTDEPLSDVNTQFRNEMAWNELVTNFWMRMLTFRSIRAKEVPTGMSYIVQ